MLKPLLVASLTKTAIDKGGAAGISAVRDLVAMGKADAAGPDAMAEWEKAMTRRKLARKDMPMPRDKPEVGETARPKDDLDA